MNVKFKNLLFLLLGILSFASPSRSQVENQSIPITEIKIGCLPIAWLDSNYVIKSQDEYLVLLSHNNPIIRQNPNCSGYSLPDIDFNKHTLIGLKTSNGGCNPPEYKRTVEYIESESTYKYIVEVTSYGICRRGFAHSNFILIPKIKANEKVLFKRTEINKPEKFEDE